MANTYKKGRLNPKQGQVIPFQVAQHMVEVIYHNNEGEATHLQGVPINFYNETDVKPSTVHTNEHGISRIVNPKPGFFYTYSDFDIHCAAYAQFVRDAMLELKITKGKNDKASLLAKRNARSDIVHILNKDRETVGRVLEIYENNHGGNQFEPDLEQAFEDEKYIPQALLAKYKLSKSALVFIDDEESTSEYMLDSTKHSLIISPEAYAGYSMFDEEYGDESTEKSKRNTHQRTVKLDRLDQAIKKCFFFAVYDPASGMDDVYRVRQKSEIPVHGGSDYFYLRFVLGRLNEGTHQIFAVFEIDGKKEVYYYKQTVLSEERMRNQKPFSPPVTPLETIKNIKYQLIEMQKNFLDNKTSIRNLRIYSPSLQLVIRDWENTLCGNDGSGEQIGTRLEKAIPINNLYSATIEGVPIVDRLKLALFFNEKNLYWYVIDWTNVKHDGMHGHYRSHKMGKDRSGMAGAIKCWLDTNGHPRGTVRFDQDQFAKDELFGATRYFDAYDMHAANTPGKDNKANQAFNLALLAIGIAFAIPVAGWFLGLNIAFMTMLTAGFIAAAPLSIQSSLLSLEDRRSRGVSNPAWDRIDTISIVSDLLFVGFTKWVKLGKVIDSSGRFYRGGTKFILLGKITSDGTLGIAIGAGFVKQIKDVLENSGSDTEKQTQLMLILTIAAATSGMIYWGVHSDIKALSNPRNLDQLIRNIE